MDLLYLTGSTDPPPAVRVRQLQLTGRSSPTHAFTHAEASAGLFRTQVWRPDVQPFASSLTFPEFSQIFINSLLTLSKNQYTKVIHHFFPLE